MYKEREITIMTAMTVRGWSLSPSSLSLSSLHSRLCLPPFHHSPRPIVGGLLRCKHLDTRVPHAGKLAYFGTGSLCSVTPMVVCATHLTVT